MKLRTILLLVSCLVFCMSEAQPLSGRLDTFISSSELLKTSEVGISVYDLTEGKTVYTYQDQKLYRPASIEKIITSVTALSVLGSDYQYQTHLAYTGDISGDSILHGDLYVVGGFDPEFMEEDMVRLAEAVQHAGIRHIEGSLVGDVSMTDSVYWGPGWSWDDTPYYFQPYLSPLMLNRGCVNVMVIPGEKGGRPIVKVHPESDYYTVDNQAESYVIGAGKLNVTRNWLSNGNIIRVEGNVNRRTTETLNLYSSEDFFMHTFAYQLKKRGISFRKMAYGLCPESSKGFYTCSRPFLSVLERALKKSDNLSAESIFYSLAAVKSDKPFVGSKDAQKVIYQFMKDSIGYMSERYNIVDGSGVSLYNYISPDLLMEYLKYAYSRKDIFMFLYNALPIAGVDGTLCYRMRRGKPFRNVRAKTGTVMGVSSLAGYVKTSGKHLLAFVIINQNALNGKETRLFQDKICEILSD